jgi:hypothetical protein
VVLNLLHQTFGGDFSPKILACLQAYRDACIDLRSDRISGLYLMSQSYDFGIYNYNTSVVVGQSFFRIEEN